MDKKGIGIKEKYPAELSEIKYELQLLRMTEFTEGCFWQYRNIRLELTNNER